MVGELIGGHAPRLGARHQGRQPDVRAAERVALFAHLGAARVRCQPASACGTDHIDIYYLHRDYNGMDLEEPLRAIDALLRAGKIRYWGVSNFRGWRIAEVVHMARATCNMPAPVVCQPYYNLLNRQPEVEVLPACRHHGLGVVPYSPIARGVLAGKYAPGAKPAAGTRAARGDKRIMQTEFREESLRDRADAEGALREQGRGARALRHGLGAGQQGGQRGDRRAAHPGAMAGLLRRARMSRSTPRTKPWSIRWSSRGIRRRPATTILRTRSRDGESGARLTRRRTLAIGARVAAGARSGPDGSPDRAPYSAEPSPRHDGRVDRSRA